jgi:RNA polymerase sigma-70 factor (ECF subfamily)
MGKAKESRDLLETTASNDEEALIEGLRHKENWAFQELIERWAEKLYQVAFRFVRREEIAREILQDVLKKVVEKIDTFQEKSKLYTWLYRITVNEALMRIRARKNNTFISWEDILPRYESGVIASKAEFSDWSGLPDEKLEQKEAKEFLRQCIDELPEDYRVPYLLKDVEQLSENEVSEILGLTKSVVKIRVHRARMFLRKKMEERYVD